MKKYAIFNSGNASKCHLFSSWTVSCSPTFCIIQFLNFHKRWGAYFLNNKLGNTITPLDLIISARQVKKYHTNISSVIAINNPCTYINMMLPRENRSTKKERNKNFKKSKCTKNFGQVLMRDEILTEAVCCSRVGFIVPVDGFIVLWNQWFDRLHCLLYILKLLY